MDLRKLTEAEQTLLRQCVQQQTFREAEIAINLKCPNDNVQRLERLDELLRQNQLWVSHD